MKSININTQFQTLLKTTTSLMHIEKQIIVPLESRSISCIVWGLSHMGRTGNKMFTIASAYSLARIHSCQLYFSPSILDGITSMFVFDIQPAILSEVMFWSLKNDTSNSMKIITRHVGCQYIPEIMQQNAITPGSIFAVGSYWQSYLHFDKFRDELRSHIFVARQPILEEVSKIFIDIYKRKFSVKPQISFDNHHTLKKQLARLKRTTWIGIHIRRSDFVSLKYASSDEYLFHAIEYYTRRYSDAHFIVVSDDKPYCEELFRNQSNIFLTPALFSESNDLITLSLCEHSIITGGTFGWWAAYLAGGEVIHDTVYRSGCEKHEHYYPPWFRNLTNVQNNSKTSY